MEAAAGCRKLKTLILYVYSESNGNHDIDINVSRPASVAAFLAEILVSPRRSGEDLGWVDE